MKRFLSKLIYIFYLQKLYIQKLYIVNVEYIEKAFKISFNLSLVKNQIFFFVSSEVIIKLQSKEGENV